MKTTLMQSSNKMEVVKPFRVGDIAEGVVVGKGRSAVYLDLGPQGTGIIWGREFLDEKSMLKDLNVDDRIMAKIVDLENENGYVELSVREAGRQLTWDKLRDNKAKEEIISIKIQGANKGELLAELMGVQAFLPVSQLSQEHYPKVEGGDSSQILKALQKFVGKDLEVQIFDLDPKEGKIILSERSKEKNKIKETLSRYAIGDVVEGEVTGVVDFGAFIKFPTGENLAPEASQVEGLIHISEIDWQIIEDPSKFLKVGDKIKAKIIDLANARASLSIKALKEDPWKEVEGKYKKFDQIKGKVTKLNPFGAFVEVEPRIQGLCHISEFGTRKKMEEAIAAGETYDFQILELNPAEHRMSLKLAQFAADNSPQPSSEQIVNDPQQSVVDNQPDESSQQEEKKE
ncbi:MAG: S1 RNA-binding domain-containing protein [Candidatus Wildermuthbacteria bacterium]|nr:S1 RNA-binding domain-containing protein [Candidatus Wildermuthbacteria bacterium]